MMHEENNSADLWLDVARQRAGATASLLVHGIGQLCTLHDPALDAAGPRRGEGLSRLGIFTDAALAVADGRVLAVGREAAVRAAVVCSPATVTVDAGGRCIVPGYVDPHTHAVFGRWRAGRVRAAAARRDVSGDCGRRRRHPRVGARSARARRRRNSSR